MLCGPPPSERPPLPPEGSVPRCGPPPLLLTDGLVLGVRGWAGAEEETLCQGEKVGCFGGLWGCQSGGYLLCGPLSTGPWSAAPVGGWKSASAWAGSQDRGSVPGDVVTPPSRWDSGGEEAAWARGACS